MKYYNWKKIFDYNADVSLVVASRGRGKTFGLRKQCIQDHLKDGSTFVEICRYKNELSAVMSGYFDKLADMFDDYIFKCESLKGYIAKKPASKKEKIDWRIICYFIALSDAQNAKKRTYKNVRRLIFDEAVLDRTDRYHKYVTDEYSKLANIVDTTTRERPEDSKRPHLYLLGNACDLLNPYFIKYGIDKMPKFGYRWYRNKTVILHYEDPEEYATNKLKDTVSGRMIAGTLEGEIAARNKFIEIDKTLISEKSKNAKYQTGFIFRNKKIGVWLDEDEGYFFINNKVIETDEFVTYYIDRNDATINRYQANRATPVIAALKEAHMLNYIKYKNQSIYNTFLDMLSLFGL